MNKKYGFKPYYKWITFNIKMSKIFLKYVSNCFKPYYKWITFNIMKELREKRL